MGQPVITTQIPKDDQPKKMPILILIVAPHAKIKMFSQSTIKIQLFQQEIQNRDQPRMIGQPGIGKLRCNWIGIY